MKELTKTEKLILKAIRNNRGSYEELSQMLYDRKLDSSAMNAIRVHIFRIKKKGYKLMVIDNWGYKEETNEQIK